MSGLLGLLGLGHRGGRVVVGVDAVRRELQAGKCWCVVLAEDASPRAAGSCQGGTADARTARRSDRRAIGKAAGHGGRRTGSRIGQWHCAAGSRPLLMEA